jgi:2-iminoacetate synthase ThiH
MAMGRMLMGAIERARLTDVAERALTGKGLGAADLVRLKKADVLVVAGIADAVRAKHRGHEVLVLSTDAAQHEAGIVALDLDADLAVGPTGQDLLVQIAMARLATPCKQGIAVSCEQIGLELAQTALVFGADALIGDLVASKKTLPLLDGKEARKAELMGLIQRSGRTARFLDETALEAATHASDWTKERPS